MTGQPTLDWDDVFTRLLTAWNAIPDASTPSIEEWEVRLAAMSREVADAQSVGNWRSGARSLLTALGLQHDELKLCMALEWLLQPSGHHGLGDSLLRLLCERVDVHPARYYPVAISREEKRGQTRADLIVRLPGAAILIEAKVRAGEQKTQCDRLAALWEHEDPTLVFLTPQRVDPKTAKLSAGRWHPLAWSDVAEMAGIAAARSSAPAGGVWDFIATVGRRT